MAVPTGDDVAGATGGAPPEPTADPDSGAKLTGKLRSVFALIVGIVGVIGVLASVIGVWAHQVLFDPEPISRAADQALQEPEVVDALAAFLTDQVLAAVSVEDAVENRLPSQLDQLAPLFAGGIRTVVEDAFTRVLDDERAREIIVTAVERAHGVLMRVLDGGSLVDGVTVDESTVSVNLLPLLGRGLTAVQNAGLLQDVDFPELERGGDPAEQIASLEDALGRDLPDDFGQLVVYESEKLGAAKESVARAQQALVVFKKSIVVMIVVTLACLVASAVLARSRRRAIVILLLGTVAAMAIGRAIVRTVAAEAPTVAIRPGARAAIRSIVETLSSGLITAVTFILVLGLLFALVAYLSGSSDLARSIRGRATSTGSSVRSAVDDHRDGVAVVAFAAAVAVILFAGFSWWSMVVSLLFAAVGAWAMWWPRAEAPAPSGSPPAA
jgi:hypothetical protein